MRQAETGTTKVTRTERISKKERQAASLEKKQEIERIAYEAQQKSQKMLEAQQK